MSAPKPTPREALRMMRALWSDNPHRWPVLVGSREAICAALDAADAALDAPECKCGVEEYQHALGCPANPDEAVEAQQAAARMETLRDARMGRDERTELHAAPPQGACAECGGLRAGVFAMHKPECSSARGGE